MNDQNFVSFTTRVVTALAVIAIAAGLVSRGAFAQDSPPGVEVPSSDRDPGPNPPGPDTSGSVRTIDGSGNNLEDPQIGSAGITLLRLVDSDYGDGISSLAGASRPSPRAISNTVCAQSDSIPNDLAVSDYVWQWGQFVDHDIDLTEGADPAEAADIAVPLGDPFFDPFFTGTQTIGLNRSIWDPATGTDAGNPRQQLNGNPCSPTASISTTTAARRSPLKSRTPSSSCSTIISAIPLPCIGPAGPHGRSSKAPVPTLRHC